MSIMQYDLGLGEAKNWLVAESSFDSHTLGKGEAIFCQGNGYLGQRATLEEEYVEQTRNLFVAGTFHCFDESEVIELPNLPDMTNMRFTFNGRRFSLDTGRIISYTRSLHLKTGELIRQVVWESPAGDKLKFLFRRFVSLFNEHVVAARVEITSLSGSLTLRLESGINGQVTNSGSQHFREGEKHMHDNSILEMVSSATLSDVSCCLHAVHMFFIDGQSMNPDMLPIISRRYIGWQYDLSIEPNETFAVEKICCVHSSVDKVYENEVNEIIPLMREAGLSLVRQSLLLGYEVLLEQSKSSWETFWQQNGIRIDSDRSFDQLAVRFALYHLNIMVKKDDSRVGIAAKGLTGEGYKGHSFWDTEIFILPYYTLTQPDTAKTLLTYRYKGLLGARRKAIENGFKGAMYPWESARIQDGEVTPLWGAADVVTGLPTPILTGSLEQHITADVAYAVWQYYNATHDLDFLDNCGYEILLETARFWASRVTFNNTKGLYEILDVIGPDEYKEHVDNNAYTNYMAHYNMRLALTVLDTLEARNDDTFNRLSRIIPFEQSRKEISRAVELLFLPEQNQKGIVPQFDGYFDLTPIDLKKYKSASEVGTIYRDYNMEQIGKLQVSKQADLLVLLLLMGDIFSRDMLEKNFDYYEARTLHDSSLSKSTHCVLACDLNKIDEARSFFHGACDTDLGPNMTTSDMGIHSAAMGGIWQCVVYGFGGVRIFDDMLHIAPCLLSEWELLSFPLYTKGQSIHIQANKQGVSVTHHGNTSVDVYLYDVLLTLKPGQKIWVESITTNKVL